MATDQKMSKHLRKHGPSWSKIDDDVTEDMAKLSGKLKHFCPDWDYMAIDETMPEFEACTCRSDTSAATQ